MPGVTGTGLENVTDCQPEAVSPLNVAWASRVPVGGPQAADVRARVGRRLVEADAVDGAEDVGLELDPDLDRVGVAGVRRSAGVVPDHSEHGQPTLTVVAAAGRADVAAVVGRADLDVRRRAAVHGPRVGPARRAASPGATSCRRRSRPRPRRPRRRRRWPCRRSSCWRRPGGWRRWRARRWSRSAWWCRSTCVAVLRPSAGQQRERLDAHVGEQVDRRLLHVLVGRVAAGVGGRRVPGVRVVEAPGPLHGARRRRPAPRSARGRA